ncbi:salt stress root protein RS1 isoform X1 [Setaria viridis]|nr:salt stress root protein RS1-like isoform X1 [Setaria viridis]
MAPWLLYRCPFITTPPLHVCILGFFLLKTIDSSFEETRQKMATYWKTKVLPGINKIFDKDGKKAAAVEFLKSFNKEELGKEIEDKKTDLEPKVVETYEASPPEVKALFKDKKPVKISKKNSAAATKFLDELAKIEFPGAKLVSDAVAKSGTTPLSPAITFILDKAAPFIPKEEPKAAEPEPAAAVEATSREVAVEEKKEEAEPAAAAATEEAAATSEAVEEKKEEEKKEEEEKPAEAAAEAAAAPPAAEEKK